MYFGHNSSTSFTFKFTGKTQYNCNLNNNINVYSQYNKWGLGAMLGFE